MAVETSKVIGMILSCLLIGAFILGYPFGETEGGTGFVASKTKKLEQFEQRVIKTGLIDEMGKRLFEKGYVFVLNWEALSKNKTGFHTDSRFCCTLY